MKNLTPYDQDCFDVHREAVRSKNRGELKNRLENLHSPVEIEYKIFDSKFGSNNISQLIPNHILAESKDDLLTLYRYQSQVIIGIREKIRSLQINTIITTCQNCTIDTANTLDHILPKSIFPEFVVNPKNLFPCCSPCNSYKLDSIDKESNQKFLNLYLDELPKQQYLFLDISFDMENKIDFSFYLQNIKNDIPKELFSTIENHYFKLHLFERMKLKSIEHISELENKITSFQENLDLELIVDILINAANKEKEAYGYNHWKCILEISLLRNSLFINRFRSK